MKVEAFHLSADETAKVISPMFRIELNNVEMATKLPICFDSQDDEISFSPLGVINGVLERFIPDARLVVVLNEKTGESDIVLMRPNKDGEYKL